MNAETWKRVEAIANAAVALEPAARDRFLAQRCTGNPELLLEAQRVLDALDAGGDFLDQASWAPRHVFDAIDQASSDLHDGGQEPIGGQRIGAYHVEGTLGSGGMGTVYRARRADDAFDKEVALKIVSGDLRDQAMRRRFERERFLLAQLEHPHIARLYDAGATDDGRPFFVMELITGARIDRYCTDRNLSLDARLAVFLQVCGAVEYAHRNLIIHRDLKPSNILVTADGVAKLLDFGLAKLVGGPRSTGDLALTTTHQRPMTPLYASPEQVSGKPLTTASDVYSLGLLLFRLLTGHLPYPEDAELDLLRWIVEVDPQPPSAVTEGRGRHLEGDLDAIVLKALRKEPGSRYGSVAELAEDLRRYRNNQPVLARRGTRRYHLEKFLGRHRVGLAVTFVVFLLTVGYALAMIRQVALTEAARDQARDERDQAVRVSDFLVEMFEVQHPETGFGSALPSRQLLDLAAARLDREATDQPVLRARLLHTMGRLYRHLGELDRARGLLDESRQIRGQVLGRAHPDTVASDFELARLAFDAGDYERSEKLARAAGALGEVGPDTSVLTAESTLIVGKARQQMGHYAEAAEHYRSALEIYQRHPPSNDRPLATALGLLGQALALIGETAEAEEALDRALTLTTRQLGEEHPFTSAILLDLSSLQRRGARFADSEQTARRAVEIFRRFLPEGHPVVLEALTYLGSSLGALGRYEESVQVRRELLAGAALLYEGDHPNHATALNELAVALTAAGEATEAIALHEQCLAMRRRLFGDHHPMIVQSHYSLALALIRAGRSREAESKLRRALALLHTVPQAGERPESGLFYTELARLLTRRGATEDAEPLARSGHAILGRGFPATHPRMLDAATVHAEALSALGRATEAEEILTAALDAAAELGSVSPFVGVAQQLLDNIRATLAAS